MAVQLVVTITAAPGKGAELARAMKARCEECMTGARLRAVRDFPERAEPGQARPARIVERPGGARRARQAQRRPPAIAGGAAARCRRARGLPIQPHAVASGYDGGSLRSHATPRHRHPRRACASAPAPALPCCFPPRSPVSPRVQRPRVSPYRRVRAERRLGRRRLLRLGRPRFSIG